MADDEQSFVGSKEIVRLEKVKSPFNFALGKSGPVGCVRDRFYRLQ